MSRTTLEVRKHNRWLGVAVIDGRDYPDRESYEQAVRDAFERADDIGLPAQFERHDIRADEPRARQPSVAVYLAEEHARMLLAAHHNRDLDSPQYTADSFREYQVTPYEDWLIFTPGDNFGGGSFLVSDPMVYEMPGWESSEEALTEARALKAAGATRRPEDPDDDDDDDE